MDALVLESWHEVARVEIRFRKVRPLVASLAHLRSLGEGELVRFTQGGAKVRIGMRVDRGGARRTFQPTGPPAREGR